MCILCFCLYIAKPQKMCLYTQIISGNIKKLLKMDTFENGSEDFGVGGRLTFHWKYSCIASKLKITQYIFGIIFGIWNYMKQKLLEKASVLHTSAVLLITA